MKQLDDTAPLRYQLPPQGPDRGVGASADSGQVPLAQPLIAVGLNGLPGQQAEQELRRRPSAGTSAFSPSPDAAVEMPSASQ